MNILKNEKFNKSLLSQNKKPSKHQNRGTTVNNVNNFLKFSAPLKRHILTEQFKKFRTKPSWLQIPQMILRNYNIFRFAQNKNNHLCNLN
jgi:hypothetical protein